jgi:hypothetical protein
VSRCRERRELLVYALTCHQSRERGRQGFTREKDKKKIIDIHSYLNSMYALIYIYIGIYILIYIYIGIYIYMFIYIYRYMGGRRPVCSVYIVYILAYISVYITGRGRRLVCSVHSYAPPLTAAVVYRYIYRCIPIYRYIEEGGLCAVCTPISAADGSRHRYIHRYMLIYYIRRRVFSAHSSTPPLTAAGIPIHTPIYIPMY